MRATRKSLAVGLAILLPAVGWTAAWLLLAREAEHALNRWIVEERSRERVWTCAERKFGGFPFHLTLDCASPGFTAAQGAIHTAAAARLNASSSILSRGEIEFSISGPLKLSGPDAAASMTWSTLTGSLWHGPDAPDLALRAHDIQLDEISGKAEILVRRDRACSCRPHSQGARPGPGIGGAGGHPEC